MKLINVLAIVAASFLSQVALAGAVIEVPVEIDAEARMAFGNLKTARFSENEQEQIGCGTRANTLSGSLFEWGFCQARLDDDTTAFCTTDNPELVDRIRGMSDYSYVMFRWDEDGNCTYFGSSIQSQYIPQYLDKKAK